MDSIRGYDPPSSEPLGVAQSYSKEEGDVLVRWTYTCSHCKYLSTRKWNMERHTRDAHKGSAIIGQIPNNKLKTPSEAPDFSYSDRFLTTREPGKVNQDPISNVIKIVEAEVKRAADLKKNLQIVMGNTGPRFPSWHPIPVPVVPAKPVETATASHTAPLNANIMPSPIASDASDILGFRLFKCFNCLQIEIVPLYASPDPRKRGGVSKHICQANWSNYTPMQRMALEGNAAAMFVSVVESWTDGATALYALKVEPTSIPEELNHVNSAELFEFPYVCEAARNMVIRVERDQILYFVSRTRASYCLAEFPLDGKMEFYFMYLYTSKRHRNPAGLDNLRNIAGGSGIAS